MKFIRKLMYFLLGTGLGVLLVIFIFGDRDIECSYFPNDRVLYDLRKKEMHISGQARHNMDERQLDTAQISMMLLGGEVDFDKSNTHNEDTCHTYWIDYQSEGSSSFSAEVMNCDSTAYLLEVY